MVIYSYNVYRVERNVRIILMKAPKYALLPHEEANFIIVKTNIITRYTIMNVHTKMHLNTI